MTAEALAAAREVPEVMGANAFRCLVNQAFILRAGTQGDVQFGDKCVARNRRG